MISTKKLGITSRNCAVFMQLLLLNSDKNLTLKINNDNNCK